MATSATPSQIAATHTTCQMGKAEPEIKCTASDTIAIIVASAAVKAASFMAVPPAGALIVLPAV
jgi:hypothetical protein